MDAPSGELKTLSRLGLVELEERLKAFEGSSAKVLNQDMPAIKLMNFWLGKVESNPLVIEQ